MTSKTCTEYEFVRAIMDLPKEECFGEELVMEVPGSSFDCDEDVVTVHACVRHFLELASKQAIAKFVVLDAEGEDFWRSFWRQICQGQGWDLRELDNMVTWMAPRC